MLSTAQLMCSQRGCWAQALFAECAEGKLQPAFQSHLDLLKMAGKDAPGQVAHLVALEHLLSQRLPPTEVCSPYTGILSVTISSCAMLETLAGLAICDRPLSC